MALTRPKFSQITQNKQIGEGASPIDIVFDEGLVTFNKKQTADNEKDLGVVFNRGDNVDNVGIIWNEINNLFRLVVTPDTGLEPDIRVGISSNAPILTGTQYVSTGNFQIDGDARAGVYMMRNELATTGLAWQELYVNGVDHQLVVSNNAVWTYEILVTGKRIDGPANDAGSFKITGSIGRNTEPSSVFLVGSPSYTTIGRTDTSWEVEVNKDIVTGALTVKVRGSLGKTIRWVARIVTLEVSF